MPDADQTAPARRPPDRLRRVLRLCHEERRWTREAMQGIAQYSREHGPWEFTNEPGSRQSQRRIAEFARHDDGIIAQFQVENLEDFMEATGGKAPTAVIMSRHDGSRTPVVTDDEDVIGWSNSPSPSVCGLSREPWPARAWRWGRPVRVDAMSDPQGQSMRGPADARRGHSPRIGTARQRSRTI